ncbi:putative sarcosine oxidase isoform X5, partial [Apostichopus japonicus]
MHCCTNKYDYIVVGCGGVGSSTLYRSSCKQELAKKPSLAYQSRKQTELSTFLAPGVLGIEQFQLGHHYGGSQDHSRIIRYSYSEKEYVALAKGAYDAWSEVEEDSGIQVVYKCGGLNVALKNTRAEGRLKTYADAMDINGTEYESLEGIQLHQKFPSFAPKSNLVAQYQKDGGLVDSALANAVHIQLARKYGADVLEHTTVRKITRAPDGKLIVSTSNGDFCCKKVVVTAGAWLNDVLKSVGVHIPVTVTQEQVTYFGTPHMKEFCHKRFPHMIYHGEGKDLYTLPIYGNSGFKIGIDAGGPEVTPSTRNYTPDPVRVKYCEEFLKEFLPRSVGPILYTKTCLYTMTSDRHFVIDTAFQTGFPDVIICVVLDMFL